MVLSVQEYPCDHFFFGLLYIGVLPPLKCSIKSSLSPSHFHPLSLPSTNRGPSSLHKRCSMSIVYRGFFDLVLPSPSKIPMAQHSCVTRRKSTHLEHRIVYLPPKRKEWSTEQQYARQPTPDSHVRATAVNPIREHHSDTKKAKHTASDARSDHKREDPPSRERQEHQMNRHGYTDQQCQRRHPRCGNKSNVARCKRAVGTIRHNPNASSTG